MKTNITLKIDDQLLREAKIMAAQEDTSISALLAQQLEQLIRRRKEYSAARRRALALLRQAKPRGWRRPSSRDELHER
jgi:hypothetical protein